MRKTRPIGSILDYGLPAVSQSTVRRAYMRWRADHGMVAQCDNPVCQLPKGPPQWNGKPLPLILDHIDGNRKNNRTGNLRLLCPNCDSLLPTRGGGNRGRIRNATADSYHVVGRDGTHEVKVMLRGVSANAVAGSLGAVVDEP